MTTVRPLGLADGPAWAALFREATRTHPAAFITTAAEAEALTEDAIAARMDGDLLGAFDGAHLIGFGSLVRTDRPSLRHRAELGPLYAASRHHGKGAGQALMDALVAHARAHDVAWLDLWVAEENARARAFYRRNGFSDVARRPDAVRGADGPETDILMTRCLEAWAGRG
ncbi:GNAT family N-acetyltransferase [uncultured Jannaschia sp.]|uniref:GNAT family N-acetyltransferase n=1 Tax=uncultured Jannaschia sp. TaxID=293347 RepID=UPI002610E184|nr:GNAT family N-acetyltransferase [uncultured Jannaschia sp.]